MKQAVHTKREDEKTEIDMKVMFCLLTSCLDGSFRCTMHDERGARHTRSHDPSPSTARTPRTRIFSRALPRCRLRPVLTIAASSSAAVVLLLLVAAAEAEDGDGGSSSSNGSGLLLCLTLPSTPYPGEGFGGKE